MSLFPWWKLGRERDHGRDRRAAATVPGDPACRAGEPDPGDAAGQDSACAIPPIPGQGSGKDAAKNHPGLNTLLTDVQRTSLDLQMGMANLNTVGNSIYAIRMAEANAWGAAADQLKRQGAPTERIAYAREKAADLVAQAQKYRSAKSVRTASIATAVDYGRIHSAQKQLAPTGSGGLNPGLPSFANRSPFHGFAATTTNPFTGWDAAKLGPAAIKLGEIGAWRAWRLIECTIGPRLYSCYRSEIWMPGQPMTGDVSKNHGVHAWKELQDCLSYVLNATDRQEPVVVGRIRMWGEVIEHAKGWRAEKASISGLDCIFQFSPPYGMAMFPAQNADLVLRYLRTIYIPGNEPAKGDTTDT